MGIFDRFRKSKPSISLPQLYYDVAYFILPHYVFQDLRKLTDVCLNSPNSAGPFFFLMAAKARGIDGDIEDAKRLQWHHGTLIEDYEYFALEYPQPRAVDLSDMEPEQVLASGSDVVLAPYFSLVVRRLDNVQYFVLGQAPIGGGTTLRCLTPEGANCNLGPGPEPKLGAFLDSIRQRVFDVT